MSNYKQDNKYKISRKQIEDLVNEYYKNPIMCLAFGIEQQNREEIRDKELIRGYLENFYLNIRGGR